MSVPVSTIELGPLKESEVEVVQEWVGAINDFVATVLRLSPPIHASGGLMCLALLVNVARYLALLPEGDRGVALESAQDSLLQLVKMEVQRTADREAAAHEG